MEDLCEGSRYVVNRLCTEVCSLSDEFIGHVMLSDILKKERSDFLILPRRFSALTFASDRTC